MNEGLTRLERHKGVELLTEFPFLSELSLTIKSNLFLWWQSWMFSCQTGTSNISSYYQCWKPLCCLIFLLKLFSIHSQKNICTKCFTWGVQQLVTVTGAVPSKGHLCTFFTHKVVILIHWRINLYFKVVIYTIINPLMCKRVTLRVLPQWQSTHFALLFWDCKINNLMWQQIPCIMQIKIWINDEWEGKIRK